MCPLACANCGCSRLFRDGLYTRKSGEKVQKWRCRECGRKFIEKTLGLLPQENLQGRLNSPDDIVSFSQLCALEVEKLVPQTETKTVAGEISQQDVKGKIVDFSFWMLKEGYSKSTIKTRTKILQRLIRLQADLFNPESVKETIAKHPWSSARKCIAIDAYTCKDSNGNRRSLTESANYLSFQPKTRLISL
jgi:hypothetical protein